MEMLRRCFMLQQPERSKRQQKSPSVPANSSRCGRRGSAADIRREQAGGWGSDKGSLSPCWHQGRAQGTGRVSQGMEKGSVPARCRQALTHGWSQTLRQGCRGVCTICTVLPQERAGSGFPQQSLQQFFPFSTVILQFPSSVYNLPTKGVLSNATGCVHKESFPTQIL